MGRFTDVVATFEAHLDDFDTLKSVSFTPIVWTPIVGGHLALLADGWALLTSRGANGPTRETETVPAEAAATSG